MKAAKERDEKDEQKYMRNVEPKPKSTKLKCRKDIQTFADTLKISERKES